MADSAAKYKRIAGPIALTVGAMLASCSVSGDEMVSESNELGAALRAYNPPPLAPPAAKAGGRSLERASAVWWVDGALRVLREEDDARIPINHLDTESWKPARIALDQVVEPSWLNLRFFFSLNEKGIPSSDVPDFEYECGLSGPCSYTIDEDELVVDLDASLVRPGVFVLEAEYITAEKEHNAADVGHFSCSWAIRLN